ncbi:MAG: hypothetical protein EOP07_02195 [Proteobacteria bacterium]|nr:MAG: hypothetical protein EOP07_02195 [Pseudomonadota bacterium]
MKNFRGAFSLFILTLTTASPAFAHAFDDLNLPSEGLHGHLMLSGAYRSDSLVKSNEQWTIPGLLMGGEAYPSSAGLALDEVFLTPVYRRENNYLMLKLGRHLGSEDLELDHVLVGHQFNPGLAVEGGKMAAIFTPFNGEHAGDTSFSSRRLVYDAIWGGQYTDEGLRLKSRLWDIDYGVELWKGNSFPSKKKDSDKAAYDLYARYSVKEAAHKFQLGGYYYRSDATARDDSRYTAAHSHSSNVVTTDPSYFNGRVEVSGLMALASFQIDPELSLGAQGELSQIKQNGKLWDLTHEASLDNKTVGLWGELYARQSSDKLSYRAERLKVQNDVYGPAAGFMAEKLKLLAADKDPYRHTLSYEHFFSGSFRSRLEWSQDFSTIEKKSIVTLGAVWSEMIFHVAGS